MAIIREELTLADRFSAPFSSYITQAERAAGATQTAQSAATEFSNTAARMQNSLHATPATNIDATTRQITEVSAATQELVNSLQSAEAAVNNAFTDTEADAALKSLQAQMKNVGLVWTNTADSMEAADMLVRVGLQDLALQGRLTASYLAEKAYADRTAAKAAEQHNASITRLKSALSPLNKLFSGAKTAVLRFAGANTTAAKSQNVMIRQARRMTVMLLSAERILRFMKNSLEAAPQDVQESWNNLAATIKSLGSGAIVAALAAMQPALDRLKASLDSEGGQKLAWALQNLASVGGQAIGFLLDVLTKCITYINDNFETVMTAASVLAAVFAAKMILAAGAVIAANLPMIAFVALIAAVVAALIQAGTTSEEIFGYIGSGLGFLYAVAYNAIATIWDVVATFAEFFATVFNDPIAAVISLFVGLADSVLSILETLAGAIDALFGSNLTAAVSGWRSSVQAWADENLGDSTVNLQRMTKLDVGETMSEWAQKGAEFSSKISNFNAEKLLPGIADSSASTAGSAGSIEKSLDIAEEELKNLVDMAERQYVNKINLTAQSPVININGQNTGNTAADRQRLADTLRDVLLEQINAGSATTSARAFSMG